MLFLLFLQVPITPANAQYTTQLSYVLHSARSPGARYHHSTFFLLLPPPFFPLWWVHSLCLLLMDVQSLVDLSVVKDLLSGVLVLSGLKLHDLLKDLSSVNGLASDLLRTAIPRFHHISAPLSAISTPPSSSQSFCLRVILSYSHAFSNASNQPISFRPRFQLECCEGIFTSVYP